MKLSRRPHPLRRLNVEVTGTQFAMARALREARERVQAKIAAMAARAAQDGREQERAYREIAKILGDLGRAYDGHLRKLIKSASRAGHDGAQAQVGERLLKYNERRTEKYFALVAPETSKSLAAVMTDKMTDRIVEALRWSLVDGGRQAAVEGLTANETQKLIRDKWDEAANDNNLFRFIDRSGRPWENARYLQMLTRTTAARVARESALDTFAENGIRLGRISISGDPDCDVCQAWEGRIIQLAGESKEWPTYDDAIEAGVFHPNCVHYVEPIDEDLDAKEIEIQHGVGLPDDFDDDDEMMVQRDEIDLRRYMEDGKSRAEAEREVTRDRVEQSLRAGLFAPEVAKAVEKLTDAELDKLKGIGVPKFEKAKKGDTVGEMVKGRYIMPKKPTEAAVLRQLRAMIDDG